MASEVQNKSEVTNSVSHFENCKSEVLKVSKKKKELLKHEFKNHRVFINLASWNFWDLAQKMKFSIGKGSCKLEINME